MTRVTTRDAASSRARLGHACTWARLLMLSCPRSPAAPRETGSRNHRGIIMPQHSKSALAFERACRVIPGGVNSPARAFGGVGGEPVFMARGEGPYLFDIDGNTYIDYIGSWGPLILGHGHPEVRAAILSALELGSTF